MLVHVTSASGSIVRTVADDIEGALVMVWSSIEDPDGIRRQATERRRAARGSGREFRRAGERSENARTAKRDAGRETSEPASAASSVSELSDPDGIRSRNYGCEG